jgi:lysophospholipase L1-like esterase
VLSSLRALRELRPTAALVSITVGANDFDFAAESQSGEHLCQLNYQDWAAGIAGQVKSNLRGQIERLVQEGDVFVAVTNYFNPFNKRSGWFRSMRQETRACRGLTDDELYSRTEVVVYWLNQAIAGAAQGLDGVAVAPVHDAFHGHESPKAKCGSAPPDTSGTWIQYPPWPIYPLGWLLMGKGNDCFHPNEKGHEAIAGAVWTTAQGLLAPQQTAVP